MVGFDINTVEPLGCPNKPLVILSLLTMKAVKNNPHKKTEEENVIMMAHTCRSSLCFVA